MSEQKKASSKIEKDINKKIQQMEQQGSEELAANATSFADDASKRGHKAIATTFDNLSAKIRREGQTRTEPSDN